MQKMREEQIPQFVREILTTGCDMCAAGDEHYLIGDADLSEEAYEAVEPKLKRIWAKYGQPRQRQGRLVRSRGFRADAAVPPQSLQASEHQPAAHDTAWRP